MAHFLSPTPFRGSRLGDLDVEEAYIYPPPPTPEEAVGIQLWECGRLPLKPGVGPAGRCRVVVLNLPTQTILQERRYRGPMANPAPVSSGQVEVTWAEGGALRIIADESNSANSRRWQWSQARVAWVEGGCPPDQVVQAIITAMA
jgi:hypothetical protein